MGKRLLVFVVFLVCTLLFLNYNTGTAPAGAATDIKVFIDELEITFDVPPFMEEGRTLVPLRAIMENLQADVNWDSAKGLVTVKEKERQIIFEPGNRLAQVGDRSVPLDVPPCIIEDRTFLPLRFISENLGYSVFWEQASATVFIATDAAAAPAAPLQEAAPAPQEETAPQPKEGVYSLAVGKSEAEVTATLGKPQRIDPGSYALTWWIYNSDPLNYLQLGMQNGYVAALYTNGQQWSFAGVAPGDTQRELSRAVSLDKTVQLTYDGATFTITQTSQDLAEKPLVKLNNGQAAIFYRDIHEDGRVTAFFLADSGTLLQRGGLNMRYQHDPRNPPDLSVPALSAAQQRDVAAAAARQMLDLANGERLQRGLPALSWHEAAADVARKHSLEMSEYGYFLHDSPVTGKTPFDRLRDAGISYNRAGENIASGYPDAFSAHEGLMNSKEHREAILNENFTHMGAGVVEQYYTQKFLTPR